MRSLRSLGGHQLPQFVSWAADASDQSSVSTSPCTNILVAVQHRMFILWFSLMFSFWRWLNPPKICYKSWIHPPKIWYKSWMFILPNTVFQLLKPSKNMSMIVNLSMVSKKKVCHVILLRRFDRAVRASTVTCAVPSLLLSSWKPLPQPICSQNLYNSQDKRKVYPPVLKHGWENVRKNGKSSTNTFQWEDLSIAMFEYQRVDLTWWQNHRKKVKDHKMSMAWPSTRTRVTNCN